MTKGPKQKVFVGDVWPLNCGSTCKVLEYNGTHDVLVELSSGFSVRTSSTSVMRGRIADPFRKSVANVGYLGVGKYLSRQYYKMSKEYQCWSDMLHRCYNEKELIKNPTYSGCTVSGDWHNFQNFGEWFDSFEYKKLGWELDKDVIEPGNKIYSRDTCCFLPKLINITLSRNTIRNKAAGGVHYRKKSNDYVAYVSEDGSRKSLKTYKSFEEAKEVYKIEKLQVIKRLAEKFKEEIDPRAYHSLMEWKLDYDDGI